MKSKIIKKENIIQLISYLFVGGCATIVEWVMFWLFCSVMNIQYLIATSFAFAISTFVNWFVGRRFTFKTGSNLGVKKEIIAVYIASIFGLAFNLLIMFILVHIVRIDQMLSKIIATGIVFMYNFVVRKWFIYKPPTVA